MGSQTVDRCPQSLPHLGESVQVLVAEAVFSLCPVVPEWKLSMGSVRVEHPHVLGGKQFNKMTRLQFLQFRIEGACSETCTNLPERNENTATKVSCSIKSSCYNLGSRYWNVFFQVCSEAIVASSSRLHKVTSA